MLAGVVATTAGVVAAKSNIGGPEAAGVAAAVAPVVFDAAEVAVGAGLLAAAGVGGKLANPAVGGAADPASKPVGLII